MICLGQSAQAQSISKLQGDPVRGAELAGACVSCHGRDGMGYPEGIPRIVGLSTSYIRTQLLEFRRSARVRAGKSNGENGSSLASLASRARSNSGMDDAIVGLADQDIVDIVSFYKTQQCIPSGKPQSARPNLADRCDTCHGKGGVKNARNVPSLASQRAVYMRRQLKLFRAAKTIKDIDTKAEGTTRYSKIMFTQSRWLTDDLIVLLSDYYESIPCKY